MPIKRANWPKGHVVELDHSSKVLRNNPLGDPFERKLHVWLPPGHERGHAARGSAGSARSRRLPVLFDLVGFTGSGMSHTNWKNFGENVPERAARLMHEGRMGPMLIVFPDCFTAYGGNQYINSSAIGSYGDYLVDELIPLVDGEFATLASRAHRGCFGKSSGGYGAIVHAMRHRKAWGAVADHSGDAYFDFVYRTDWPRTLDALASYAEPQRQAGRINVGEKEAHVARGLDDGRVKRFLESFWRKGKASDSDTHVLMMLCMAASYDPDPKAPNGFRLPFNLETGELLGRRWNNWLRHDPIYMIESHVKQLRSLKGLWIDCGWSDQYFIHYGSRILSKRLAAAGVPHVYEEFPDNHSDIDYRLDSSLPYLYQALRP
jgi:enterochelin esterase-like enzyme